MLIYYFRSLFLNEPHTLFVTPAFDAIDGIELEHIPKNKKELIAILKKPEDKREIYPKKYPSYRPQNISKWMNKKGIYKVIMSRGDYFEPYFVTHRYTMLYEEMFNSYGYNKLSQVESMQKTGHSFKMLPDTFIVHLSHGTIKNYTPWDEQFSKNKRYMMKDNTFRAMKNFLPGLFVNSYYPSWLKKADILDCSSHLNPSQRKFLTKVMLEKKKISFLKKSFWIGICILILLLINACTPYKKCN